MIWTVQNDFGPIEGQGIKPLTNFSAKANKLQKDPLSTDIKKGRRTPFYHHEKKVDKFV